MIIYNQQDIRWGNMQLGKSGLSCHAWGCYCASIAQILTLAGWDVTPGDVITKLNAINGFTSGGLAIWAKVHEAYPQFTYGGTGYRIVQGKFTKSFHYMAEDGQTLYDPWTGTNIAPCPLTGSWQNIGCTQAPRSIEVVETVQEAPGSVWVTVSVPRLNVRTEPTTASPTVPDKQLRKGDRVECLHAVMGQDVGLGNVWLKTKVSGLYIYAPYTDYHNQLQVA